MSEGFICPKCGKSDWTSRGIRDSYDSSKIGIDSIQLYASKKCNKCGYVGTFLLKDDKLDETDLEILEEAKEIEKELDEEDVGKK